MSRAPQLVRARPKAIEYLPEWAKCCDWRVELLHSLANEEMTVYGFEKRYQGQNSCQNCDAPSPAGMAAILDKGDRFALELLDLDEGPVTQ